MNGSELTEAEQRWNLYLTDGWILSSRVEPFVESCKCNILPNSCFSGQVQADPDACIFKKLVAFKAFLEHYFDRLLYFLICLLLIHLLHGGPIIFSFE